VVSDVLAGGIQSGIRNKAYGNATTIEQYEEALKELRESIPARP
jgi:hypothetical protein